MALQVAAMSTTRLQDELPLGVYPGLQVGWHVDPESSIAVQSPIAPFSGGLVASHGSALTESHYLSRHGLQITSAFPTCRPQMNSQRLYGQHEPCAMDMGCGLASDHVRSDGQWQKLPCAIYIHPPHALAEVMHPSPLQPKHCQSAPCLHHTHPSILTCILACWQWRFADALT